MREELENHTKNLQKRYVLEKDLLQAMAYRDTYKYYGKYFNNNTHIPQTGVLLKDYAKYFELYPEHKQIDFDLFATHFASTWHNKDLSEEDKVFYCESVIPKLKDTPSNDFESSLIGLLGVDTLDKINKECEDKFDVSKINEICKEYEKKSASICRHIDTDLFTIDDVDLSIVDTSNGLAYALPGLHHFLGGMVQGQLVVIGAGVGAGKSAFCITQAVHTFKQLSENDGPILYFNSEGSLHALFGRFLSNLYSSKLQNGYKDVVKNQDKIISHFKKNFMSDKFLTFGARGVGPEQVRNKVEKYKPSLVIIDMLDAMKLDSKVPTALGYQELYLDLRDIASSHCPILGTSQAGDSAFFYDEEKKRKVPKKWLSIKDLYFSNDGKQGAADTIIMIGMDDTNESTRYVRVVKDKADAGDVKLFCELTNKYSKYEEI